MQNKKRMPDINKRLYEAVLRDGRTITELARRVGVSRITIGKWIYYDTSINVIGFARLCKELQVSTDYILYGKES